MKGFSFSRLIMRGFSTQAFKKKIENLRKRSNMGASNLDNLFFLADVGSENRVVCLRFPLLPELPVSTVCSRIKNLFAWSILEVNSMWPFTSPSPKIGLKAGRLRTCQTINDSGLATLLGEGERCWSWHNFLSRQWEIANFIFQNERLSFTSLKQLPTLSLMLLVSLYFLGCIAVLLSPRSAHSVTLSWVQTRTLKRLNSLHERWPRIT